MPHSPVEQDQVAATRTVTGRDAPRAGGGIAAPRHLSVLLFLGGLTGLLAATVLLVEKVALLADPDYVPSCSINPVLSCGSVMVTPQAEAFGFPNPLLGVVGFAVVTTVGAALLAGATFRGWFWAGLQTGVTAGVLFVHWLIAQSLYVIEALCPYCMVVWAVTIPLFLYTTLHTVTAFVRPRGPAGRGVATLREYHGVVLTAWYLLVAAAIAVKFWTFWQTLLT
ncbi:vitamin K epoxide reductase family protein [Aquipuribacter hungaricus]|uniref:Vitamin K epoxide reductase family protein n=1 Tax=Aquipuribacter hungaricus TaxID=545624 RepID=A0ABV7WLL1_9MICO